MSGYDSVISIKGSKPVAAGKYSISGQSAKLKGKLCKKQGMSSRCRVHRYFLPDNGDYKVGVWLQNQMAADGFDLGSDGTNSNFGSLAVIVSDQQKGQIFALKCLGRCSGQKIKYRFGKMPWRTVGSVKTGGLWQVFDFIPADNKVEIVNRFYQHSKVIEGEVVNGYGSKPIVGAKVQLIEKGGLSGSKVVKTGADGKFSFKVDEGFYQVKIFNQGMKKIVPIKIRDDFPQHIYAVLWKPEKIKRVEKIIATAKKTRNLPKRNRKKAGPKDAAAKHSNITRQLKSGLVDLPILFEFNSDQVTQSEENSKVLKQIHQAITAVQKKQKTKRVLIIGHTDSRGSRKYNQILSIRRAQAVSKYLVSKFSDLTKQRFVVIGRGESDPVCRQNSEECYQQNRRVSFVKE